MTYQINDRFRIEPDPYCWVLVETHMSTPKKADQEPKPQERKTYHPTLQDACEYVLQREAKGCDTAEQLRQVMESAVWQMRHAIAEGVAA